MSVFLFFLIACILSLGGPWVLPKRYNKLKYTLFGIAVVLCIIVFIRISNLR